MKILWFTWKDLKNPLAGGAEVVNEEIAKRLATDGHEVKLVVGGYKNCKKREFVSGYEVIRVGGRFSVYLQAYRLYKNELKNWPDIIIEEVNTIPFFSRYYTGKKKSFLLFHQLCRQVWFYQMPLPIGFLGYLLEPLYLKLLKNQQVLTISESSRDDLVKYGFDRKKISIFPVGIEIAPVKNVTNIKKFSHPTVLSLGAIRSMKRTDHQIKAFELAKNKLPELQLIIAGGGEGKYFDRVMNQIKNSPFSNDIKYLGKISKKEKISLMQKSHLIMVTSVKEGWGLIVTEAASQSTPAVVYKVDGLKDSVQNNLTGLVSGQSPVGLAEKISFLLSDNRLYKKMQRNAWKTSLSYSFDNCYKQFRRVIFAKGGK